MLSRESRNLEKIWLNPLNLKGLTAALVLKMSLPWRSYVNSASVCGGFLATFHVAQRKKTHRTPSSSMGFRKNHRLLLLNSLIKNPRMRGKTPVYFFVTPGMVVAPSRIRNWQSVIPFGLSSRAFS